jgi:EAL domain-containing protein (putative c-di-GMP-specific phosphodiesterase class I)/ActR/RegA family two-component response regulator
MVGTAVTGIAPIRSALKGRLLIFDDDEAVAVTLASSADSMGMETRVATRFEPFLMALESWIPTHIALDLLMPEMDGVEVLRLLAERRCRAMIIITSGVGSRVLDAAHRSAEAYSLNIVGVLSKPFKLAALRDLLERSPPEPAGGLVAGHPAAEEPEITEAEFRCGLERREFELAYQPKIHCATGELAGFEALARWRLPSGEVVMPDRFIPLAERTGLVDDLTDLIFDQALRWMDRSLAGANLTMSLNLSPRSITDIRLADRLLELCVELAIDPARLILELTETSTMADPAGSLALLTRFRMKGFHLSIDDFGTGYSTMAQLVRLPFSEMKIDKSFVITAGVSRESRTVIKSLIELGHNLELTLTAEGVEDADTLAFLKDLGCDLAQGYHIARPMTGEAAAAWVAARGTPSTAGGSL